MKTKLILSAVLLVTGMASFSSHAQVRAGGAAGGSLGSSRVNSGDFDGDDLGWKAFIGGYGEVIGLEVGYVDFGNLGGGDGPEASAWTPALLVGIPLGVVQIYGKVGQAFYEVDRYSFGPFGSRPEVDGDETFYGVGVRAGPAAGLGFRVEYERFELERNDVDLISAGLELRFGAPQR